MRESFLKGREPDIMPIEWEDPRSAIGEWSIAKTPRILHGMSRENPNKGFIQKGKEVTVYERGKKN